MPHQLLMEKPLTDLSTSIHSRRRLQAPSYDPKYAWGWPDPDCDRDQVLGCRNAPAPAAPHGAAQPRLPPRDRDTVSKIEKIETALEPKFQEHFVYAMALPKQGRSVPKLSDG
ncbi:drug:proton antiporter, partial [Mesorhizobium calcicola]